MRIRPAPPTLSSEAYQANQTQLVEIIHFLELPAGLIIRLAFETRSSAASQEVSILSGQAIRSSVGLQGRATQPETRIPFLATTQGPTIRLAAAIHFLEAPPGREIL